VSGDREEPTQDPDVGSVAQEATRLLGALSDWAREHVGDVDEHLATGAAECTYCPVCRTVHVLRRTDPEVRAQLATAATSLLHAAAGLLGTAVPNDRARDGGVERIDLDDAGDWPDDDSEEDDR
jgi:hypothetical protein